VGTALVTLNKVGENPVSYNIENITLSAPSTTL
jgi:hypothetical protein